MKSKQAYKLKTNETPQDQLSSVWDHHFNEYNDAALKLSKW